MPVPRTRPATTFEGRVYSRNDEGYYVSRAGTPKGFPDRRLHRDVWSSVNGPIPDGFDIHHIDGDKENNHPSNLEALSKADHSREHASERGFRTWSYEQWSESNKRKWALKQPTERTCHNCGGIYFSTGQRAKYCNARCRVAHNRDRLNDLARERYDPAVRREKHERAKRRSGSVT
jgi:hypothetical protein